jgi:hypothetical protein
VSLSPLYLLALHTVAHRGSPTGLGQRGRAQVVPPAPLPPDPQALWEMIVFSRSLTSFRLHVRSPASLMGQTVSGQAIQGSYDRQRVEYHGVG